MADPEFIREISRVRPIDSEIASLATSLGPDIRPSSHNGKSTPTTMDLEKAAAAKQAPVAKATPSPYTNITKFITLFSISMSFVVATTPVFFITSSLPYIVADIGGDETYLWLGIAYSISAAAVAPAAGALSDFLTRRGLLMTGSAIVTMGMIMVGAASKMSVAVGGMAVAGFGAALAEVVAIAALVELSPVRERGTYIGTGFILLLPFSAIPAYAQIYSSSKTWRWGAWISIIIACFTFTMTGVFYRPPPRPRSKDLSIRRILARIDYLGILLLTSGIALFLLGLQWGGFNYPWRSAHVITTMTLGLLLIIGFMIWQKYVSAAIIPSSLFQEMRTSILTLVILGLAGAASSAVLTFFPLEIQQIFGSDELHVARILVPLGFALPLGIILVNYGLSYSQGANRELFVLSSCFIVAGIAGLASLNVNSAGRAMGLSFLGGLGVGGIVQPAATILTIICPDDLIGTIVGLALSVRFVGASVGSAIYLNVLENRLGTVDGSPTMGSYFDGFRVIYLVTIAFGGAALVASVFLRNVKKYMVERVAVTL